MTTRKPAEVFPPGDTPREELEARAWAEAATARARAAIDHIEGWLAGDTGEQEATWDYLKTALDEDRLSDRPLFSRVG